VISLLIVCYPVKIDIPAVVGSDALLLFALMLLLVLMTSLASMLLLALLLV
jgi:hypothetical protein